MATNLKNATEEWATKKNHGLLSRALLSIMTVIYTVGVKTRLALYSKGILKAKIIPCMVISIGNITAGGTGKTPMTIHIARRLVKEGSKVVVLSRGYKGTNKGIGIVSDGENVLMGPEEAGDEPCLIAEKLKGTGQEGVPVIVGADRYLAGLLAIEKFKPDVIILDDGFQHIALARDKNIVLIDSDTELTKEKLLPSGTLREPIRSLRRARIIMIKDKTPDRTIDPYLKMIDKPVVAFAYEPSKLVKLKGGGQRELSELKDKKVFIFSGIASPVSFERTIERLGALISGKKSFPDHYSFNRRDIDEIKELSKGAEFVITTEKDAVRLRGFAEELENFFSLSIEVKIDKEENFFRKVR
ncbi:MAG: tetraacyldisaccharide 4'-kinase [Thermodesulfobacteriota bacterium]